MHLNLTEHEGVSLRLNMSLRHMLVRPKDYIAERAKEPDQVHVQVNCYLGGQTGRCLDQQLCDH